MNRNLKITLLILAGGLMGCYLLSGFVDMGVASQSKSRDAGLNKRLTVVEAGTTDLSAAEVKAIAAKVVLFGERGGLDEDAVKLLVAKALSDPAILAKLSTGDGGLDERTIRLLVEETMADPNLIAKYKGDPGEVGITTVVEVPVSAIAEKPAKVETPPAPAVVMAPAVSAKKVTKVTVSTSAPKLKKLPTSPAVVVHRKVCTKATGGSTVNVTAPVTTTVYYR